MPCPVPGEFRVMTSGLELLRGGCDVCSLWSCGSCWDALVKCAVLWPDMWHTFQPVWTQYLHVSSVDSPACVQCARNGLALLGWKPLSSWESPVPEAAGEWFQLWEHWWACVSWFLADSSPNSRGLLACLMAGKWVALWNKWNCSPCLSNCLWQNEDVGEEQNSCTMLFLKEVLHVQNLCFSCSWYLCSDL